VGVDQFTQCNKGEARQFLAFAEHVAPWLITEFCDDSTLGIAQWRWATFRGAVSRALCPRTGRFLPPIRQHCYIITLSLKAFGPMKDPLHIAAVLTVNYDDLFRF
jgi:hypothetical protein